MLVESVRGRSAALPVPSSESSDFDEDVEDAEQGLHNELATLRRCSEQAQWAVDAAASVWAGRGHVETQVMSVEVSALPSLPLVDCEEISFCAGWGGLFSVGLARPQCRAMCNPDYSGHTSGHRCAAALKHDSHGNCRLDDACQRGQLRPHRRLEVSARH